MAATIPSAFFLILLYSPLLVSSEISPSPSPDPSLEQQGQGSVSSIAIPPSSLAPISPSPVDDASPPAPPVDHSPASEPSPSPSPSITSSSSTTPSPAPVAADVRHSEDVSTDNNISGSEKESSGGGMSAGKKTGVAIGVLAAAAFVGLAVVVYKKRQENVRRSRYGYNARMMEMI